MTASGPRSRQLIAWQRRHRLKSSRASRAGAAISSEVYMHLAIAIFYLLSVTGPKIAGGP